MTPVVSESAWCLNAECARLGWSRRLLLRVIAPDFTRHAEGVARDASYGPLVLANGAPRDFNPLRFSSWTGNGRK